MTVYEPAIEDKDASWIQTLISLGNRLSGTTNTKGHQVKDVGKLPNISMGEWLWEGNLALQS